jgi:hypothetical protein
MAWLRKVVRSKWLVAILVAVALLMTVGCYGNFKVTKSLYEWNGEIENEYLESAAMIGMIIIPAYEVAMLADAIVFNPIEFWTGDEAEIIEDM